MENSLSRSDFIRNSLFVGISSSAAKSSSTLTIAKCMEMDFDLVTYLLGKDWDVSNLIKNCKVTGFVAFELGRRHDHDGKMYN